MSVRPQKTDEEEEEEEEAKAAEGVGQDKAVHFSGWPFEDEEEYETSESDGISDEDAELEAVALDDASAGHGQESSDVHSLLEQLAERRRAMPPMEHSAKETGGVGDECSVALCPCVEQQLRVRKLLCLLHTITDEDCSCILANACWDTTSPEVIPASSQATAAAGAVTDDAVAVQLPAHCAHALLMHGASADHAGRDGQCALDAAVMCKNVAVVGALCAYGADASAYANQETLSSLALAADSKDKRISKIQEMLKKQSVTGKGSAFEAAQSNSRSAWLRLAARICWAHNPQAPPVQRNRDASQAPDAALTMPMIRSFSARSAKPAADLSRVPPPHTHVTLCYLHQPPLCSSFVYCVSPETIRS
jgi:hypothetical protein